MELIYNWLTLLYSKIGVGKRLQYGEDIVVVFGGTNTNFGSSLCENLVNNYNVYTILLDRLPVFGLEKDPKFKHIFCDFAQVDSVYHAMKELRHLNLDVSILINNMQEGYESMKIQDTSSIFDWESIERCTYSNLVNVMIATKSVIEWSLLRNKTEELYIVNVAYDIRSDTDGYNIGYIASHAGLNQFHDSLVCELKTQTYMCGKPFKCLIAYQSGDQESNYEVLLESMERGLMGEINMNKCSSLIENIKYLYNEWI